MTQQNFKRLMHNLFLPTVGHCHEARWQPPADIYQSTDGKHWLLKFDLAGVQQHDLSWKAQGRRFTLCGCRRDSFSEKQGHRHYRMEISYSQFERSIDLPFELDPANITCDYQDGMLLVHIHVETNK